MKRLTLAAVLLCAAAQTAAADEFEEAMRDYVTKHVATWASDPILVDAIRAQNAATQLLPQSAIDELDMTWRAQANTTCGGLILNVIANPAASFLRDQAAATNGAITEAILMDSRGLNVATTQPTTDYWQGDEDKYTATFLSGTDSVHYGAIELDESTQQVQGQVSMTITDTATGEPIGALTVGINLTALM